MLLLALDGVIETVVEAEGLPLRERLALAVAMEGEEEAEVGGEGVKDALMLREGEREAERVKEPLADRIDVLDADGLPLLLAEEDEGGEGVEAREEEATVLTVAVPEGLRETELLPVAPTEKVCRGEGLEVSKDVTDGLLLTDAKVLSVGRAVALSEDTLV